MITIISFCQYGVVVFRFNGESTVIKADLFYVAFNLLISLNALPNFLACKTATNTQIFKPNLEDQNNIINIIDLIIIHSSL